MPGPSHLPRPFAAPPQRERSRTPGKGTGRPTPSLFIPGVPRQTPIVSRAALPAEPRLESPRAQHELQVPETERQAPAGPAPSVASGAFGEEAWLSDIAREPDWTLQTPSAAATVEAGGDAGAQAAGVEPATEGPAESEIAQPSAQSTHAVADPRAQELEEALSWGEEKDADEASAAAARADVDEATWPYLDLPVDEFGFPILPEGYEALLSGRLGAQPNAGETAGQAHGEPAARAAHGEHDPERVARVLQTLAEQIRAGALRLPGEVDRGDEAVVLAATLTALLSRNRE